MKAIQWVAVLWTETHCWCERSEENDELGWSWKATVTQVTTLYNCGEQRITSEWTTCQVAGQGTSGSTLVSQEQSIKTGQTGKTQTGLMNVNSMNPRTQPPLCQQSRLVMVVVKWCGKCLLGTLWSVIIWIRLLPAWWCTMSQSKSHPTLVSWTWQWIQYTSVATPVTWSESNRAPWGCDWIGDWQHEWQLTNLLKLWNRN